MFKVNHSILIQFISCSSVGQAGRLLYFCCPQVARMTVSSKINKTNLYKSVHGNLNFRISSNRKRETVISGQIALCIISNTEVF